MAQTRDKAGPQPETPVTAALVIIGDEILSGRIRDENTVYIANHLSEIGIDLKEVRIVPDDEAAIAGAINALRHRYSYVLTTGGIGPTHDDITADAVGRAFGLPVAVDERALAMMRERFSPAELTGARLRMARIPKGAALLDNVISKTPGFMVENVIVMAGIPQVMQVMLDAATELLQTGRKLYSTSVVVHQVESEIAQQLEQLQAEFSDVKIGSYPFYKQGRTGTQIVLRSPSKTRLKEARRAIARLAQ